MASMATISESASTGGIRTQSLCRHYAIGGVTVRAVHDVSLQIAPGEFAALLGMSGSGKSTLLGLLAGMDQPTSGSVHVAGTDLSNLSRDELAHYRLRTAGMIFQAFNLIGTMTLLENVELPM